MAVLGRGTQIHTLSLLYYLHPNGDLLFMLGSTTLGLTLEGQSPGSGGVPTPAPKKGTWSSLVYGARLENEYFKKVVSSNLTVPGLTKKKIFIPIACFSLFDY